MIHCARNTLAAAVGAAAIALGASQALAQGTTTPHRDAAATRAPAAAANAAGTAHAGADTGRTTDRSANHMANEAMTAAAHVDKARQTLSRMQADPEVKRLLAQAKGVFIVPDYGRAALGVGGQGGAGVLLVHSNRTWTGPAFYNLGGVSVGAQAGIAAGPIAMILMDDKAVNAFGKDNKFSLNADAGLTIVDYSVRGHGSAGRGDIVMWSDTKGAFANLSVSVTDVNYDDDETAAYYGKTIAPRDVVAGNVRSEKARPLLQALAG